MSADLDTANHKPKGKKVVNLYKKLRPSQKAVSSPCYELVFLLRSDMSAEDVKEYISRLKDKIKEMGGSQDFLEYWGLRSLSYEIRSMKKAHFYCTRFAGSSKIRDELDRLLRINSNTLRFIFLRLREMSNEKTHMLLNLDDDIADGLVIHDARYVISL